MPEPQTIPDPVERYDAIERDVLYLLTGADLPIWSVPDIGRAIENHNDAVDAVRNLQGVGLIHKTIDGYVFASRAGFRAVQMIGQVI